MQHFTLCDLMLNFYSSNQFENSCGTNNTQYLNGLSEATWMQCKIVLLIIR